MKKKVISILLAVAMLFALVQTILAFADGGTATPEDKTSNLVKEAQWTDDDKTQAEIQLTSTFDKKITDGKILFLGGLCNAHTLESSTVVDALEACSKYGTVTYKLFSVNENQSTTSGTPIEGTLAKGKGLDSTVKSNIKNKLTSQRHVIQYDIANVINNTDLSKYDAIVFEFDGFKMGRQSSAPTTTQRNNLAKAGKKLLDLYKEGKVLWIIPPKTEQGSYDGTSTYIFGDYYISGKDISGSSKINDNYRKAAFDCLALMAPEDYLTSEGKPKDYPASWNMTTLNSFTTLIARANASEKNKIYVTYDHSENVAKFLSQRFSSHGYQTIDVYDRVNDGFIITKVSGQYYDGVSKTFKTMAADAFSYKIDKDDPQVVTATFNVTKLDLAQVRLVINVKVDVNNDPFEKTTKVDTNDGKATAKYMDEDDEGKPIVVHEEEAPPPNLEKIEHKITTSVTNGTISPTKYILEGKNYKVEYAPTAATGYALDSVKVDGKDVSLKDYPNSYTFSNIKAAHEIVVKYLPTYPVTFETNGGSAVGSQTVKEGDKATKPQAPTKTGYTFDDWYADDKLTQKYDFDTPITEATTIYAGYIENTADITYYMNDGTSNVFEQDELKYTEETKVTGNDPTRDHYVFLGWDENPAATSPKYAQGSTDVLKAANVDPKDITLYAIWDKAEYTVDFVTEHGTKPADQKIKYQGTVTDPKISAKGYIFNGWYTDSGCTQKYDFATEVDKDFTLYGDWTEKETKITYLATKDAQTPYDENTIKYTEEEDIPATDPTRDHYVFLGWDKNPDATTPTYSKDNPVVKAKNTEMADTVLYGIWEKEEYTVDFVTNGGTPEPADQTVKYLDTATKPVTAPAKTGYTFKDWYTDSGCTQKYDFSTPVEKSFTLYADYTQNEYELTFDANGGSNAPAAVAMYFEDAAVIPTDEPARTGYIFKGWATSKANADSGTVAYLPGGTYKVAEVDKAPSATLYAVWEKEEYTVNFVTNGGTPVPQDQTVKYQDKAQKPATDPAKTGYIFNGWYTDTGCTQKYDFNTPVEGNRTLYAGWTEKETTITYYPTKDAKSPYKKDVLKFTQMENIPTNPVRAHYIFLGWDKNPDAEVPTYTSSNPLVKPANTEMADTVLYGIWEKEVYTIKFDTNEGEPVPGKQAVDYGNLAKEPGKVPYKEGYTFGGWFIDEDCTIPYDFNTEVMESMTLHAKWIPLPVETGDNSHFWLWTVIGSCSALAFVTTILLKRRKEDAANA